MSLIVGFARSPTLTIRSPAFKPPLSAGDFATGSAIVTSGAKPDGQRYAATIKDLSGNGVGLVADCRFPVETVLYIRQPESTNPPFMAEVVHHRQEAEGWFHGCKIIWTGDPRNHA